MIHYLKRNKVNVEKYDFCIKNALNSRIYAYSWYLDIVADNWDVLVLNDYEAVMPLPWRQKYFIKYIYPPAWTQQLGVFSSNTISEELIVSFIKAIPRKFKKITIQFNSGNVFKHKNITERVNYILPLNRSYEEVYKEYRADRKNRVKQGYRNNLSIKEVNIQSLIEIGKRYYSYLNINNDDYLKLKKLAFYALKKKNGFITGIERNDGSILGGVLFLESKSRITYLFSVVTDEGKNKQVTSSIIDSLIKDKISSNKTLDFEGSMIDGIADFYKSFGGKKELYYLYKQKRI
ncbi:hypothetical protein [uncultured Lutibacter sp.]|uniref:hypothetical protein n=1 Tax=uncultured Lutibacter sp. TaxID=437739 RepID=UPI0026243959|nr:hypothetical protein [uncultured Lutibacter sp.]